MLEDTKLLLTAIASEIRKNPEQAIAKIEKLRLQIPNSYEGFRTKEELEKNRIQIIVCGATVFRDGFYFIGIYRHFV